MNDRRGVLLVLYDLAVMTPEQRHNVNRFRKELISMGFLPFQKSVFVKLLHNMSNSAAEIGKVKRYTPKDGSVYVIPLSLNSFQSMQTLRGNPFNQSLFADDLVIL